MRRLATLALLAAFAFAETPAKHTAPPAHSPAEAWWSHIEFLADDKLEGRDTGTAGHRAAAQYAADQFKQAGLKPAGSDGYFQPIAFTKTQVDAAKTKLAITAGGKSRDLVLGDEVFVSRDPAGTKQLNAPLVFLGYGLKAPELNHDDYAGMDVKGKVVVYISRAPEGWPALEGAHYRSTAERWKAAKAAGAIGFISVRDPNYEIPWKRSQITWDEPSVKTTDPRTDRTAGQEIAVSLNPEIADVLFEGTGHSAKELIDLAVAGKPLPRFDLKKSLTGIVVVKDLGKLKSQNIVAVLPGNDPKLKDEYVALSAHIDHEGKGKPQNGDPIYNGAMDNASGTATMIEVARALASSPEKPRRSVLFVLVTAEEKGLVGSRYFAINPTVPKEQIVANINVDMFLPIIPLKKLVVYGETESDLGKDTREAAAAAHLELQPDPEPQRLGFVRSDQYSFVTQGIPALSPKIGYDLKSPEAEVVAKWRKERYHAPSDDLSQPVDFEAAASFNKFVTELAKSIASRDQRPQWNQDSFFRRFAQ